ncbi:response regulator [Natronosalvus rutilus]|uniref:Response regulator n=1 Tax=Natronosalvus rutilus TaxID=2953753 RepID=A0A9E7N8B3_9EURY|nr:response regulator [Natronosalvus rutilus]
MRLIEEAFRDGHINNHLHTVTDGQAALDFIHRRGEYEDAPRPDLILLDLHLPRVDGEDVLHEIKYHEELEDVPVVILSGMDEGLVKSRDLDHDADEDAVLEKPVDLGEFVDVIREFDDFRLSVVRTDEN